MIQPSPPNQESANRYKKTKKEAAVGEKKTKIKTRRVVCWAGTMQETTAVELLKTVAGERFGRFFLQIKCAFAGCLQHT